MKTFLSLMVVALLLGAGYEYYVHGQDSANYVQQRSALTAKISEMKQQNKEIADGNDALTKQLDDIVAAKQQSATSSAPADTNAAPATSTPPAQ